MRDPAVHRQVVASVAHALVTEVDCAYGGCAIPVFPAWEATGNSSCGPVAVERSAFRLLPLRR